MSMSPEYLREIGEILDSQKAFVAHADKMFNEGRRVGKMAVLNGADCGTMEGFKIYPTPPHSTIQVKPKRKQKNYLKFSNKINYRK